MRRERTKNKLLRGVDLPPPRLLNKLKSTGKVLAKLSYRREISATSQRSHPRVLKDLRKEGSTFYSQFNMNHLNLHMQEKI